MKRQRILGADWAVLALVAALFAAWLGTGLAALRVLVLGVTFGYLFVVRIVFLHRKNK
ncbi:hypothetical protein [Alistipes sp.]|uniref:hypothetical protein n=1 Tax=Alistipes sp. TaxID=1872444 RepID=UPI0025C1D281|nr:hypothetical protein [Alistipes sp.]